MTFSLVFWIGFCFPLYSWYQLSWTINCIFAVLICPFILPCSPDFSTFSVLINLCFLWHALDFCQRLVGPGHLNTWRCLTLKWSLGLSRSISCLPWLAVVLQGISYLLEMLGIKFGTFCMQWAMAPWSYVT